MISIEAKNVLENSNLLKDFIADKGIEALFNLIEYKATANLNEINSELGEVLNPQSYFYVASAMLTKVGYFKLQKPLRLKVDISDTISFTLAKNSRLTDGVNMFLVEENVNVVANERQTIILQKANIKIVTTKISNSTLFFHYSSDVSLDDLINVEITAKDKTLKYSQCFLSQDGEYSYELGFDKKVKIVFKLKGLNNLQNGDDIEIKFYKNNGNIEVPETLSIIGQNSKITNILIKDNYEPHMSLSEMRDFIRYGKNTKGSIVYNDDFKNFIINNIPNIESIKVWQEQEMRKQEAEDNSHINRLFISYIAKNNEDLNSKITNLFVHKFYGKNILIVTPKVTTLTISLKITKIFNEEISNVTINSIKNNIIGIYDDTTKFINRTLIQKIVLDEIKSSINIEVTISDKGTFYNQSFFKIDNSSLTIEVKSNV